MSSQETSKNVAANSSEKDMVKLPVEKLRERIQFYQDENIKMDCIIEKLKILKEEQLKLLKVLESDEMAATSRTLSHEEKLRKHSHYAAKVKLCIKMYTNLNEKLFTDIKRLKSEIENSKAKLNNITPKEDLKILEAKVKRYENELIKLEKKYPWLKSTRMNLPDISEQVDKLNNLRNVKQKLEEDLATYKGLKPDITEANKQLQKVKAEYENILKEFQKL